MIQLRYGGRECAKGKTVLNESLLTNFTKNLILFVNKDEKKIINPSIKQEEKRIIISKKNTHIFTKENVRRN